VQQVLDSGGDQGDSGEEFAHPKPPGASHQTELAEYLQGQLSCSRVAAMEEAGKAMEGKAEKVNQGRDLGPGGQFQQGETSRWAIEVYKHKDRGIPTEEEQDDCLEIDLDEEEEEISRKYLAIAVFYFRKSFNAKYLFAEMMNAWGIASLA
jgi:hypothetical protein